MAFLVAASDSESGIRAGELKGDRLGRWRGRPGAAARPKRSVGETRPWWQVEPRARRVLPVKQQAEVLGEKSSNDRLALLDVSKGSHRERKPRFDFLVFEAKSLRICPRGLAADAPFPRLGGRLRGDGLRPPDPGAAMLVASPVGRLGVEEGAWPPRRGGGFRFQLQPPPGCADWTGGLR